MRLNGHGPSSPGCHGGATDAPPAPARPTAVGPEHPAMPAAVVPSRRARRVHVTRTTRLVALRRAEAVPPAATADPSRASRGGSSPPWHRPPPWSSASPGSCRCRRSACCRPTCPIRATSSNLASPSRPSSTTGTARWSSGGSRNSTDASSTSPRSRPSSSTRRRPPRTGPSGTTPASILPALDPGRRRERLRHERTWRLDDHPAARPGASAPRGRRGRELRSLHAQGQGDRPGPAPDRRVPGRTSARNGSSAPTSTRSTTAMRRTGSRRRPRSISA